MPLLVLPVLRKFYWQNKQSEIFNTLNLYFIPFSFKIIKPRMFCFAVFSWFPHFTMILLSRWLYLYYYLNVFYTHFLFLFVCKRFLLFCVEIPPLVLKNITCRRFLGSRTLFKNFKNESQCFMTQHFRVLLDFSFMF